MSDEVRAIIMCSHGMTDAHPLGLTLTRICEGGREVRLESVPVFETLMDNAGLHPILEPYTRGPLWREVDR